MDQIKNKPESELPWEDLPDWQDYIRGPVEWYDKDYCYAVHACNAYPKLIEMLRRYEDVLEKEFSRYGIDKNRATDLINELGEVTPVEEDPYA